MCPRSELSDVRLVVDSDLPAPARIGLRWRPWLRAIHLLPAFEVEVPLVLPAPIVRSASLAAVLSDLGRPPVLFAEQPNAFPPRLQIQTTTRCQVGCPYCPRPGLSPEDGWMDERLFVRIVEQCGVGCAESLELYLHAEPLEDQRIERLADLSRSACPDAMLSIVTHERSIDRQRAERLARSALDVVFVSVNVLGDTPVSAVRARLERVAVIADALRAHGKELVVVTLTNLLRRPGPFRRACTELHLPLESFRATSRAESVDIRRWRHRPSSTPPHCCDRPFTTAHIRFDGAVIACCEDWHHERLVGHAEVESLAEIWSGEPLRQLRREQLERSLGGPCDRCELAGAVD